MSEEKWLTVKEAAQAYNVTIQAVYLWIWHDRVLHKKSTRFRGTLIYRPSIDHYYETLKKNDKSLV